METKTIDWGGQKIPVLFRKMFFPTLFGTLSIASVGIVDGIFVGQKFGSIGIAAINLTSPIYMILAGIGLMIGSGCSVVSSIRLSEKNTEVARINVTQAVAFVSLLGIALSLGVLMWTQQTARLLGSSDTLLPLVKEVLIWYSPVYMFYLWNIVTLFVIRLDGSPKFAMWCNILSAILNIFLDWLFLFPMDMSIGGAPFASAISVAIPGLMEISYLLFFARTLSLTKLTNAFSNIRQFCSNLWQQCKIGFSSLLGEILLANLMLTANLVFMKYLGDAGVGAFGIIGYYLPFVYMTGNAIGQSGQPIISYNFGQGNQKRVNEALKIMISTSVICGLIYACAFVFVPKYLVELFIGTSDPATPLAIEGCRLIAIGFMLYIINFAVIGYYQSIKRIMPANTFSLLRGLVFLVPGFILLPLVMGTAGIWLALPVAEFLTSLCIVIFAVSSKRDKKLKNW